MAKPKKPKVRRDIIIPSCPVEAILLEMRVFVELTLAGENDIPRGRIEEHRERTELCDWVLARVRAIYEGLTEQEQAEVAALMPTESDYLGPDK